MNGGHNEMKRIKEMKGYLIIVPFRSSLSVARSLRLVVDVVAAWFVV